MYSVPCTIQVIRIEKVLSRFFSLNGLLEESLAYINHLKEFHEPVENLIQGNVWKEIVEKK